MITPIVGSVEECLKHLATTTSSFTGKSLEDDHILRNRLAETIGVVKDLTYRWFKQGVVPTGANLLKLRLLLELLGYQIRDLNLDANQRNLAHQIALSVVTAKGVGERVGIHENRVFNWAHGKEPVAALRVPLLQELLASGQARATEEKRAWVSGLRDLDLIASSDVKESQAVVSSMNHNAVAADLAKLVAEALPIAERLLSDEFSEEDRSEFRRLTTQGRLVGVFHLSNLLSQLCSERARNNPGR